MTVIDRQLDSVARAALDRGVDLLANAVKATLGPLGRRDTLEPMLHGHLSVDGDATFDVEMELGDPLENHGATMVKQVVRQTFAQIGDGTTTAVVIAQSIFTDGIEQIAAGADPMAIKRGIDRAVGVIVAELHRLSLPVRTKRDVAAVATSSAKGDRELGSLIADAFERVGANGAIAILPGAGSETTLAVVNGITFEREHESQYSGDAARWSASVLENSYVLVYDDALSSLKSLTDLSPALEEAARRQRTVLIVAQAASGIVRMRIVLDRLRGSLDCRVVTPRASGERRRSMLEDIAAITGARVIGGESGVNAEQVEIEALGRVTRVILDRSGATIIEAPDSAEAVETRTGVAMITLPAMEQAEMREQEARIRAAINASRAALEEGVVVGGGVALLRAQRALESLDVADHDEWTGVEIVRRALEAPLRTLADNADVDGAFAVAVVRASDDDALGYNALTGDYENLLEAGVVDPTKVVRTALQNAASVVGLFLTTSPPMLAELVVGVEDPPIEYADVIPEATARDQIVRRIPHIELEPEVAIRLGARFGVKVYGDMSVPRDGEEVEDMSVVMPAEVNQVDVQVWLSGTRHFHVDSPSAKPLTILRDHERTTEAEFSVTVIDEPALGEKPVLHAYFTHAGRPCGRVSLEVAIEHADRPREGDGAPPEDPESTIGGDRMEPHIHPLAPDILVDITDPNRDRQHLFCQIFVNGVGMTAEPERWDLDRATGDLVGESLAEFVRPGATLLQRSASLRGAGLTFFTKAPQRFRDVYWDLVDKGTPPASILVESEEPFIPWELMIPSRGLEECDEPLGATCAMGRWIHDKHRAPRQHLSLSDSLIIAPAYAGQPGESADGRPRTTSRPRPLKKAKEEAELVSACFRAKRTVTDATDAAIDEAFDKCGASVLHFICHGAESSPTEPQRIFILGEDPLLSSQQLRGMKTAKKACSQGPLVFLNACNVGRPSLSLVGVGGFAKSFIDLGAGAVVAPLWSVKDEHAHVVAQLFYRSLVDSPNTPMADVIRDIRRHAYTDLAGEDTYAAYCFYGDPLCRRGSTPSHDDATS